MRMLLLTSVLACLTYVDGNTLLGDDGEGRVDGSHPSDLRFMRKADAMEPILSRLLR